MFNDKKAAKRFAKIRKGIKAEVMNMQEVKDVMIEIFDIKIGRNTLTKLLREEGVLDTKNKATKEFKGEDYFLMSYKHSEYDDKKWQVILVTTAKGLEVVYRTVLENPDWFEFSAKQKRKK